MASIFSPETIAKIAHLARLEYGKGSGEHSIQDELNKIVKMVGQISSATTKDIEPMAHPLDMPQPLRTDEVTESDKHQELQKSTEWKEADLYLVPKVIE